MSTCGDTIKASCGITVDDVAKRLVDYGFHAPTMSFPVADTLMIEPTESEAKRELDRFCDAMIAIRAEIAAVERGEADPHDNVLTNAPHTHHLLMEGDWSKPYSREQAFFPLQGLREDKYWPPVGRIDNVAGDRNLVCSCRRWKPTWRPRSRPRSRPPLRRPAALRQRREPERVGIWVCV